VLDILEKGERGRPAPIVDDLPLFSVARGMEEEAREHPAVKALEAINPDELAEGGAGEDL
jgi:hypothetical protein